MTSFTSYGLRASLKRRLAAMYLSCMRQRLSANNQYALRNSLAMLDMLAFDDMLQAIMGANLPPSVGMQTDGRPANGRWSFCGIWQKFWKKSFPWQMVDISTISQCVTTLTCSWQIASTNCQACIHSSARWQKCLPYAIGVQSDQGAQKIIDNKNKIQVTITS